MRTGAPYAKRPGTRLRKLAGVGGVSSPNLTFNGKQISYARGGRVFARRLRGPAHRVAAGNETSDHGGPAMTAGGAQVMFANGPFVYLYAVSNRFGKKRPQGYCLAGQGDVRDPSTSSRGNYIIFSCAGGGAYLTYVGPK